MRSFFDYLKSQPPEFWFTALLIGIGGSWISVYLVRGFDRISRSVCRRWGERTEAKAAARKLEAGRLRANPHEQVMMAIAALDTKLQGLTLVLAGLLLGFLGWRDSTEWLLWVGMAGFFAGNTGLLVAFQKLLLVKEARR